MFARRARSLMLLQPWPLPPSFAHVQLSTESKVKDNIITKQGSDALESFLEPALHKRVESLPNEGHLKCLNTRFKLDSFKPLQWTIIDSILNEKRDNFATMPTGFGKSLCYQFPAVYTSGVSIVISPLISLMQDQVKSLEKLSIKACYLGPSQTDPSVLRKLVEGFYRIVYITPETALSPFGSTFLQELYYKTSIILVSIDEAHCVLQWGNNFRPAYRNLGLLRNLLPSVPMLALSGTMTNQEKYGIYHILRLRNPNEVNCGFNRPNLYYMARQMTKEPFGDISQVLLDDKQTLNIQDGSVIIYCLTKRKTEKVARVLNEMGIKCDIYHSALDNIVRKRILEDFLDGNIKVIVATTAFGMGINKQNVRIVIHYGTPLSMECYYQGVGRAGRDGKPALCVLYYSYADFSTHRIVIHYGTPLSMECYYQGVGRAGRDGKPALCVLYYSYADFSTHRYINKINSMSPLGHRDFEDRNNVMKKYISLTTCRRKFILDYFDCATLFANSNKCCDNCITNELNLENSNDFTSEVNLLLSLMDYYSPCTLGFKSILSILLGNKCDNISIASQTPSKFFGSGCHRSEAWWKEIIFLLDVEKYVKFSTNMNGSAIFTKLELNYKGKMWLQNKYSDVTTPIKINLSNKLKKITANE